MRADMESRALDAQVRPGAVMTGRQAASWSPSQRSTPRQPLLVTRRGASRSKKPTNFHCRTSNPSGLQRMAHPGSLDGYWTDGLDWNRSGAL